MELTILTGPLEGHGGEETVLKDFVSNLQDKYSFNLLVSEHTGDETWLEGISPYLTNFKVNRETNRILKLKFILKNLRLVQNTAVICLTPRMVFLANLAKKLFHKKYLIISWMHFSIRVKFNESTAKQLLKADYHFAISSGIQDELISLGIPENRIALIYNPVLRQKRTIIPAKNETRFVCVSRIQFKGQKNLSEIFKALSLVDSNFKWSLDIYGADASTGQQEKAKCIALCKELKIEDHVNWCGWYKNVWDVIETADCLLMSSTYEGFGMALAEAISRGVPVISSNCPTGPTDIVSDENGFLYQMGDIQSLASKLTKFIEKKCQFDSVKLKDSLQKMYLDIYEQKVKNVLGDWIGENE